MSTVVHHVVTVGHLILSALVRLFTWWQCVGIYEADHQRSGVMSMQTGTL